MAGGNRKLERILVGVDGSPQSAGALEWAMALARPFEAEVIAVYVLPKPAALSYGYAVPVELDPRWRAELRDLFELEWSAALDGSGLRSCKVTEIGRPATVIANLAEKVDADLVVVGRRGRGGLAEMMLGSVSHELSHHCKRPVMLISAPAQEARRPDVAVAAAAG